MSQTGLSSWLAASQNIPPDGYLEENQNTKKKVREFILKEKLVKYIIKLHEVYLAEQPKLCEPSFTILTQGYWNPQKGYTL